MEALRKIQQELKAPKNQFNSFGGFNYRSAEDILEAVKPLLDKYGVELTLSDAIEQIGGRIYVKATAWIYDGKAERKVTGYAREPEQRRSMDESQITGTASSYARKYALNGLFLIDDQKDADSGEYGRAEQKAQQPAPQPQRAAQKRADAATVKLIYELSAATGTDSAKMCGTFRVASIEEMTPETAKKCLQILRTKQARANRP